MATEEITLKDRVIGSLLGGAVGDALGYQCEFTRNIKEREYTGYLDNHGLFSDDTQMMLFTANALLWGRTRSTLRGIAPPPAACLNYAYHDWYRTQNNLEPSERSVSWIDKLSFMRTRRAPGNTCLSALSGSDLEFATIDNPPNTSKGCGCTMRVAPIGLFIFDLDGTIDISAQSAVITHGHPLAIIATAFLGGFIHEVAHDTAKSLTSQTQTALAATQKYCADKFEQEDIDVFSNLIAKAIELSGNDQSDLDNIRALGEGWVADEAVAIGLYCCLRHPDNFIDAVIAAVNHDGDSDSTGIIAGNIMGARFGVNAIPEYYLKHIEHPDFLRDFAEDFATVAPDNLYDLPDSDPWITKYVHCKPIKEYE